MTSPVERAELRHVVARALAGVPDEFAHAVVLRDVAELDYGEIADVLQVPVGTVKSRIARGRRLLAASLADDDALVGNRAHPGDVQTSPDDVTPGDDQ